MQILDLIVEARSSESLTPVLRFLVGLGSAILLARFLPHIGRQLGVWGRIQIWKSALLGPAAGAPHHIIHRVLGTGLFSLPLLVTCVSLTANGDLTPEAAAGVMCLVGLIRALEGGHIPGEAQLLKRWKRENALPDSVVVPPTHLDAALIPLSQRPRREESETLPSANPACVLILALHTLSFPGADLAFADGITFRGAIPFASLVSVFTLAFVIIDAHRGKPVHSRGRHWALRGLLLISALLAGLFTLMDERMARMGSLAIVLALESNSVSRVLGSLQKTPVTMTRSRSHGVIDPVRYRKAQISRDLGLNRSLVTSITGIRALFESFSLNHFLCITSHFDLILTALGLIILNS